MNIEWIVNRSFEKWMNEMPRFFNLLGDARIRRTSGYIGAGVEVEGGGIYQTVETMLGVTYTLSVYHKGGKGYLSVLEPRQMYRVAALEEDKSFKRYSLSWRARAEEAWIVLADYEDGVPSIFDELSFTSPGFEDEESYQLATNGGFEFWRIADPRDAFYRGLTDVLMPDHWKPLGSAEISQTDGFDGLGVRVEAKAVDSGLQQFMAIDKGEKYVLSMRHKGGPGRVILLSNDEWKVEKSITLERDENWKSYSASWTSDKSSICLRLIDEPDEEPSYFDDASLRCQSSGPRMYEPPINICFVLHIEPVAGSPMATQMPKPRLYEDWRRDLLWLKRKAEEYGHKLTALFNGEYMEYVVDFGHEDEILQLIRDGHEVGSHFHFVYRTAPHQWHWEINPENIRRIIRDDPEYVKRVWATGVECVEKVIPHSENISICASGTVELMTKYGFKIDVGGRLHEAYTFLGHNYYFPFRPASDNPLKEDFDTPFVSIAHYANISAWYPHFHPSRLIDMQMLFLNLYRTWLSKESAPEPEGKDKVWSWGWNTHPGYFRTHEAAKENIEKMLWWLNENFVGKKTSRGNIIAKPATMKEVYEEFLQWEKKHQKESSFSYIHPKEEITRERFQTRPNLARRGG